MQGISEDYAGKPSSEKYKELMARLKELDFAHLIFSLRKPYGIELMHAP